MATLPTITALKLYDVSLITVLIFALNLIMKMLNNLGSQLSPVEKKLLSEYNAQVRLVNRLNSVETFVERAKATRKTNSLEKKSQELAEERQAASAPLSLHKHIDRI